MDKLGKISTTSLNAYLRAKHGNQLDVGASLLIRDIGEFENPTPRQQMTSMLQKVSKDEVNVERSDKKSTAKMDITRSLFPWQTHAKIPDNVVGDGYFHNLMWKLHKRYSCPSKAITAFKTQQFDRIMKMCAVCIRTQ